MNFLFWPVWFTRCSGNTLVQHAGTMNRNSWVKLQKHKECTGKDCALCVDNRQCRYKNRTMGPWLIWDEFHEIRRISWLGGIWQISWP